MFKLQLPIGSSWFVALTLAVTFSALAVVYSVHVSRTKMSHLEQLLNERDQYQVEYGQLILEQSTWGSYAKLEYDATRKLDMHVPDPAEIVIVK